MKGTQHGAARSYSYVLKIRILETLMIAQIEVAPVSILQERLKDIATNSVAIAPNLLAAFLFLVAVWIVAAAVRWGFRRALDRPRVRPALRDALLVIVSTVVWITGLLVAATIALPGLSASEALAGLGIGSLAVGLAFRDIFENFLAGLLILVRQPMRMGDFVECQEVDGTVERISLRDTYLRRTDGVLVMVPNAYIYKHPVRVLTDQTMRRQSITVGVAYGENVDAARDVIKASLADLETVDRQRPVQVFAKEFSTSSIDFEVAWWTGSRPVDIRASRDEVVGAIKLALDDNGIEIPFPYRTLVFKTPLITQDADVE